MAWKDFEKEPTENLIEYIQWQNDPDYLETSKDAFGAFCFRFYTDLIKKCRIVSKNWGYDSERGDELADEALNRFWKYPSAFNKSNCKSEIDKCVIFYLYRIAQNLLSDHKKTEMGDNYNPYNGDEEIIREFPDISGYPYEKKRELKKIYEITQNALARLSPKHKIVYLTYKTHEKDGYKLPRELLKSLRDDLDLTQNSIRIYKNEAFNTVKTYLDIYGSK
jgi:DNA-directed RNA polymerase specialized sigma24 family protein